MNFRYLSDLDPPPPGFTACSPSKRLLLGAPMVMYTGSLEALLPLVDRFHERVHGIIATPAPTLQIKRVGPLLWHFATPPPLLPQLQALTLPALETIHAASSAHERSFEMERNAHRIQEDLNITRGDYQRVTRKLQHQLRELEDNRQQILRMNEELELRVQQRTAELAAVNKELEDFSYSVSHDLRAPVRAIIGFGESLLEDAAPQLSPDALQLLRRIIANGQRMRQLVDGLLALTQAGHTAFQMRPVDLGELARNVFQSLANGAPDIHFQVGAMPPVLADERLMRAVLENLLANAIKFSRKATPPRIDVGCFQTQGRTLYFVADNGVGFDPQRAAKLFQPFHRFHSEAEFEGSGIGLATVRKIIERHGGTIRAESSPGQGARFLFTLGPPATP